MTLHRRLFVLPWRLLVTSTFTYAIFTSVVISKRTDYHEIHEAFLTGDLFGFFRLFCGTHQRCETAMLVAMYRGK